MKIKLAFAAILALPFLAGCGGPSHGTIEKKEYDAPWSQLVYQCMGYNSKGICTFHMWQTIYYPAEYQFKLKTSQHEGWTDVPPQDYSSYQVGQQYP